MLRALQEVLRRRGSEGWSVGGTVRDRLLGQQSPDLDVVVTDEPGAVARELAAALDSPWFALSVRHGAYRVLGAEGHVDIAGMRGSGILDDLALRDFTINAMADPVLAVVEELVDPFEGRRHLADRVLVAVSDRIFHEDPLRLMRAVRFSHGLGLTMDSQLEALVRAHASEVGRAAPERIASELAMILGPEGPVEAVRSLHDLGLLEGFLPEAAAGMPASLLAGLDAVVAEALLEGSPWRDLLRGRLDIEVDGVFGRLAALRLAILLHSAAPEAVSATADRLRLSGALSSLLVRISSWQAETGSKGLSGPQGLEAAAVDARSAVLFLWSAAPWEPEVVLVAAAEAAATGSEERSFSAGQGAVGPGLLGPGSAPATLLERWASRAGGFPAPPFDGRVLMEALGMTQGPELGRVLKETLLAWESGEISDLDGALAVAAAARAAAADPQ